MKFLRHLVRREFPVGALVLAGALAPAPAGSINRQFYEGITGTTVASLTNDVQFPSFPTFWEQLDDFTPGPFDAPSFGLQGKDNSSVQFGTWIRGYLEAPETGSYVFYIASDDNSEFWLGTDHTEESRRLIAFESGAGTTLFTGLRLEERRSQPITLQRGQKYHLEILHKQGAGGSLIQAGWERPDGVQEIIPALHLAQHPVDPYLGGNVSSPIFNSRGFNGGNLPGSVAVNEGGEILLQLDVIAVQPTTIQWTLGGQIIPGENLSFLRLKNIPAADSGKLVQALINSPNGSLNSAATLLNVTPDTTAPSVAQVRHRGNPNQLQVTFNERVEAASATNPASYELRTGGGAVIPIQTIALLPGETVVQLDGAFNFALGTGYSLTVRDVRDTASAPNTLSPNPTVANFSFNPEPGTLYTFNQGLPAGLAVYGSAGVAGSGGHDGSGYLRLTDATAGQVGAAVFTARRHVDQLRAKFKTRIANGSATPAEGFSLTVANDLPTAAFGGAEEGFDSGNGAPRFIVSFDAFANNAGDATGFAVKVNGGIVTNVPAGANGIPAIYNAAGTWVDADLNLKRDGRLTLTYGGVTILNQFATGFTGVPNAQVALAARTGASFETHWFDDVEINFADGDIGFVGIGAGSDLGSKTSVENDYTTFSVLPTGASPFTYQWLKGGEPIPGETNRILRFLTRLDSAGQYSVIVSNDFSGVTSAAATLTVTPDTTAPTLLSISGLAGGFNQIRLNFSEPVAAAAATSSLTYDATPLQVLNATISPDGREVTLFTSQQQAGAYYGLGIAGLPDTADIPNSLTTFATFLSTVSYVGELLADNPVRYWRFEELTGTTAVSETSGGNTAVDGTYVNSPLLGGPALVPSQSGGRAVQLSAAGSQRITVPNGSDINDAPGPWAKKSFSFWFKATSVPAPGAAGLSSVAGIYEQGADARGIQFYLWRNPANSDPNQGTLVFHAFNNAADGPGAPFGQGGGRPIISVQHPIQAGQAYHVVGVFDGDATGTTGKLILYVNGAKVGEAAGVGQMYPHGGDVQFGRGNARHHNESSGDAAFFDGVLDEFALYNVALPASRVLAQYQAAVGILPQPASPVVTQVDTRGNSNGLRVTFDQAVLPATATNLANYVVRPAGGAALPIASVARVPGTTAVQLNGNFNFQVGPTYEVVVRDVTNLASPADVLSPNPTITSFSHPPNGGPVGISPASQLGSVSATENQLVRFEVVATGASPYQYQWFWNDAPLSGATNAVLQVIATAATTGDYHVRVRNEFSEILSVPAALGFNLDVAPAQVTGARALAGQVNEFRLRFNEPLDPATATDPATYTIAGSVINAALLSADQQGVTLRSAGLVQGQEYVVQINGLKDQSTAGNPLAATLNITAEVSYVDEVLTDGPVRYWRFGEPAGTNRVGTIVTGLDNPVTAAATLNGSPTLGVAGLVPNANGSGAIQFNAGSSDFLAVPNGADINITSGPWAAKSFSFWFKAHSLPRGGASPEAPVIWEQGGDARGLGIYLYGTQDAENPTEALLVWNVYNNAADGPTGGWGVALGNAANTVFVAAPVQAGQVYHVVAVYDGGTTGLTGSLRLYVNGGLAGTASGAGQLFNHSANIQFGRGAFVRHDGVNAGNLHYFHGVLDEFAAFNQPLTGERIGELYTIGQTPPPNAGAPVIADIQFQAGSIFITWEGDARLERKDTLGGNFQEVAGATSPYTETVSGSPGGFFRLVR